jgi:hypothetical protein
MVEKGVLEQIQTMENRQGKYILYLHLISAVDCSSAQLKTSVHLTLLDQTQQQQS